MPKRIQWLLVGTALLISASVACGPTGTPTTAPPATATAEVGGGTDVIEPTPTSSPTLPPTATASPTAAPPADTPTASPVQPEVSSCDASGIFAVVDVVSDDALNVHSAAGVANPIVGTIPPYGMGVRIMGDGEQVDGALWVPVQYEEINGWVNANYLACQIGAVDEAIAAGAAQIIQALKSRDLETLSRFVHPAEGVRFSPYAYIRVSQGTQGSEDLVFSAAQTRDLFNDLTVHNWGAFDGSGS